MFTASEVTYGGNEIMYIININPVTSSNLASEI